MYEAFDAFLSAPTWHTTHPNDEGAYFTALATVVHDPDFRPDRLGVYIDGKREAGEQAQANLDEATFNAARERLTCAAWAVQKFLEIKGTHN